jgi:hypothetical protein
VTGANPLARRAALALGAAAVAAISAGCSSPAQPTPGPSPSPSAASASPTPTPTLSAADALAALARKGASTDWTATYTLQPTDPTQDPSNVTFFRIGERYRIDIAGPKATTLFMTTDAGYVSCRVEGNQRTCLLVGPLDKPVPKVFDPGLQRVVTTDLKALASGGSGLTVERDGVLAEVDSLPAAECFQVSGLGVDAGEYCFTATGVPRKVSYPTGTLSMTTASGAPNPEVLTPPVSATPLPTPTAS